MIVKNSMKKQWGKENGCALKSWYLWLKCALKWMVFGKFKDFNICFFFKEFRKAKEPYCFQAIVLLTGKKKSGILI